MSVALILLPTRKQDKEYLLLSWYGGWWMVVYDYAKILALDK